MARAIERSFGVGAVCIRMTIVFKMAITFWYSIKDTFVHICKQKVDHCISYLRKLHRQFSDILVGKPHRVGQNVYHKRTVRKQAKLCSSS